MSLDEEIARFDWPRLRTYTGRAERMPDAVRGLATARTPDEARRRGDGIEHALLSVAGPCEACAPVATVLVAALPGMTPAGRGTALELLALIGAAEISGPAHEQIGTVDLEGIRRAVTAGFRHYTEVLRIDPTTSCVELIEICALADPGLVPAATGALAAITTEGRSPALMTLVHNTLNGWVQARPGRRPPVTGCR